MCSTVLFLQPDEDQTFPVRAPPTEASSEAPFDDEDLETESSGQDLVLTEIGE